VFSFGLQFSFRVSQARYAKYLAIVLAARPMSEFRTANVHVANRQALL